MSQLGPPSDDAVQQVPHRTPTPGSVRQLELSSEPVLVVVQQPGQQCQGDPPEVAPNPPSDDVADLQSPALVQQVPPR